MYQTETRMVREINSAWVDKIDRGLKKEAEEIGTAFIRQKVRESAFTARILTPQGIGPEDLDKDETNDLPKKIVEKEPDSVATFIPFRGSAPMQYFHGPRYAVYFGKIESQRNTKSKFELMTYSYDIRKVLEDNCVKDMADQLDLHFLSTINTYVDQNTSTHEVDISSPEFRLSATGLKVMCQALLKKRLPVGKLLIPDSIYLEALELDAMEVSYEEKQKMFRSGIKAIEDVLWGVPVVATIKHDLFESDANGDPKYIYLFAPETYFGVFYELQEPTLHIESRADIIKFWSYSAPGIGIGNFNGVVRGLINNA